MAQSGMADGDADDTRRDDGAALAGGNAYGGGGGATLERRLAARDTDAGNVMRSHRRISVNSCWFSR